MTGETPSPAAGLQAPPNPRSQQSALASKRPKVRRLVVFAGVVVAASAAAVIGIALGASNPHTAGVAADPATTTAQAHSTSTAPAGTRLPSTVPATPAETTAPQPGPTAAPATPVPAPSVRSGTLYAITQDVVMRDGPTSSANRIGLIPAGTMLAVRCKISGEVINGRWGPDQWWDFVTFNGTGGYVTDEWVDTKADEADPTKVPVCRG